MVCSTLSKMNLCYDRKLHPTMLSAISGTVAWESSATWLHPVRKVQCRQMTSTGEPKQARNEPNDIM